MSFDRRVFLTGSAAALTFAGCSETKPVTEPEPGRGWIVRRGAKVRASEISGRAVIADATAFTPDTPFRIASITKLVVAMVIRDLAEAGRLVLDAPVADILPDTPEGLTLAHLLSHRSGLRDPEVYWADISTDIRTLYHSDSFTHPPGDFFRYANLNYGLAATVVEAQMDARLDLIVWKWLTRQGLDAGLNWSGVSPRKRRSAAALYRQNNASGDWAATVDLPADIPMASPTYLGRETAKLTSYTPGTNGTLFSPQGGLRMSLNDLLKLGIRLHDRPAFHRADWIFDGRNGEDENGHFLAFGPGSYVYSPEMSPIPGVPLVGHLGWAYGAHTGLFIVPGTDVSLAFARLGSGADDATVTGGPTSSGRASQFTVHQALFDALAPTLRAAL